MTDEFLLYKRKQIKNNILIKSTQIMLFLSFILIWELLSHFNIINTFIFSCPSKIIKTFINLINNNLFIHVYTTLYEIIIAFSLSMILGLLFSIIFYKYPLIYKIFEPFINLFNSLPKVALGPLIIIWFGANNNAIIIMALFINLIVTTITILNGFQNTNKDALNLFKIFNASKIDTLIHLIIPSSKKNIIEAAKLSLSLSLIGVIMGEFLCCKKGIGYLILYGTQVFDLSLVMCGLFILLLLSFVLYSIIKVIEKRAKI